MATIRDICKLTGLSLGTVSNYLNGKKIQEENVAKIEKAIAETSYIPSNLGRYLKSGKAKNIGIVASDISAPYVSTSVAELEQGLSERGYRIFFCNSRNNVSLEKENLDFMIQQSVSAVVLFPTHYYNQTLDNVFHSNIPIVMCDSMSSNPLLDCNSVNYDNYQLSFEATELFIQEGHRRIACISGCSDHYSSVTRISGYRDALKKHGLNYSEEDIYYCDFDNQKSFEATLSLLQNSSDVTACLITSNNMLLGFLRALAISENRVHKTLSYITFSREDYYDLLPLRPTYIQHDFQSFGRNTLEIVENLITENASGQTTHKIANSSIILGDSHKLMLS